MIELTHVFVSPSADTNAQPASASSQAPAGSRPALLTSFGALLAGMQANEEAIQNETLASQSFAAIPPDSGSMLAQANVRLKTSSTSDYQLLGWQQQDWTKNGQASNDQFVTNSKDQAVAGETIKDQTTYQIPASPQSASVTYSLRGGSEPDNRSRDSATTSSVANGDNNSLSLNKSATGSAQIAQKSKQHKNETEEAVKRLRSDSNTEHYPSPGATGQAQAGSTNLPSLPPSTTSPWSPKDASLAGDNDPHKVVTSTSLAFAVRVQSNTAASSLSDTASQMPIPGMNAPGDSNMPFNVTLPNSSVSDGSAVKALDQTSASEINLETIPNLLSSMVDPLSGGHSTSAAQEETETTGPNEVEVPTTLPDEQPAGEVKVVQLQMSGPNEQKVDLKLTEKSGALTMSVRTGNDALNKALQQSLPELTDQLKQQYRTQWWQPNNAALDQPSHRETFNTSAHSSGTPNNDPQASQEKSHSGQQGRRDKPQPDWLEEVNVPRGSNQNRLNQNGTKHLWQL